LRQRCIHLSSSFQVKPSRRFGSFVDPDDKPILLKKGWNAGRLTFGGRLPKVFYQPADAAFPRTTGAVENRKIPAGKVGTRGVCREGDHVPTHMKIDVFTVFLFEEKTMGSTLGAKQVSFSHNRFPAGFRNPTHLRS
jgi:hypothetical protein